MQIERRKYPRKDLKAEARIPTGAFAEAFRCQVLNISPAGARVDAADIALPAQFKLLLDRQAGILRTCQVIWRNAYTVGVRFLPSAVS
jgi:hypothetical protein